MCTSWRQPAKAAPPSWTEQELAGIGATEVGGPGAMGLEATQNEAGQLSCQSRSSRTPRWSVTSTRCQWPSFRAWSGSLRTSTVLPRLHSVACSVAPTNTSSKLSWVSLRVAKGPEGSVVRNLSARPRGPPADTDASTGFPATTEKVVFWPQKDPWVPGGQRQM